MCIIRLKLVNIVCVMGAAKPKTENVFKIIIIKSFLLKENQWIPTSPVRKDLIEKCFLSMCLY